ncbi:MAG TPA: bacterial transcriptional activator domain-containing protein, partial [Candidatus Methylomirabilis sp.]
LPAGLIDYSGQEETYTVERSGDAWYDVSAFEELIRRARSGAGEGLLEEALAIYRGRYLGEVYSDWAARKRDELHRMFVEGLTSMAGAKAGKGEVREAVDLYRRAISEEPYREDLHRALMQTLAAGGRHAEAIRHFQDMADLLRRELDIRPAEESERLYQSIQKETGVLY